MSCCCWLGVATLTCVEEQEVGVIENCGKFSRIAQPGFVNLCLFENIVSKVSLKIRQIAISCDTKTKDNVFVRVQVAVQYKVLPESVHAAYYRLTDHEAQIRSYVFDVIRSSIPRLDLDDAFAGKDHIVKEVQQQISSLMNEYGYVIVGVLMTDLDPDIAVKNAMNEINASQRMREAATEKAEAEKILLVKAAEAEADTKELQGKGVARQRKAMVDGLKDTVNEFADKVQGSSSQDVLELLLLTNYFDMLRETRSGQNTLLLPHSPATIKDLKAQLNRGKDVTQVYLNRAKQS